MESMTDDKLQSPRALEKQLIAELAKQQHQTEEDQNWLQEEENKLVSFFLFGPRCLPLKIVLLQKKRLSMITLGATNSENNLNVEYNKYEIMANSSSALSTSQISSGLCLLSFKL
jgi:hypothetical protein